MVLVQATAVDPYSNDPSSRVVQATAVSNPPNQVVMGQVVQGQAVGVPIGVVGYGGQPIGVPAAAMYGNGQWEVVDAGGTYGEPAEEPLCAAVLACFCCCWCVGLLAIFKAQEVGRANAMGDFALAQKKRKEAIIWIAATVFLGVFSIVLSTIWRMSSESATPETGA
mmetsp:Transcript_42171/g.90593  ORF Transcript_42171/g.90593 Transcript_42171/m.90593 type:complete len:167 (+) Transcript_42171:72-572(+)